MELSFQNFVGIFQIVAGLGTTGAFIYAGLTFRRIRHSEQITIAHEIQDDLSQIEKDLEEILTKPEDTKKLWSGRYINKLEWLCFLVNIKEIKNKKIINSFRDSIISNYESIFERFISDEEKKNPKVYPEFKTLYNKFKRSKPKPF